MRNGYSDLQAENLDKYIETVVDDLSILCGMFLFLPIVKGWAWLYDPIINHLYINIWIIIYQTSSRKGEVWRHYLLAAALVIGV